ncbi:hypothetical protein AgCh_017613 [Apium graveolens]
MLAAVVRHLRDSDFAVHLACVAAVTSMASQITKPPFSTLSKPLIDTILHKHDLNLQTVSLESRRFDKVKVIRDTMNQASEMWMMIIDEEDLWLPQLSIVPVGLGGMKRFVSGQSTGTCLYTIAKQKEVPAGSMPERNDTCSEIIGSEELNSAMKDMDDVDHAGSMPGGNDIGILDLDSG